MKSQASFTFDSIFTKKEKQEEKDKTQQSQDKKKIK